jgi:hypothetical protein
MMEARLARHISTAVLLALVSFAGAPAAIAAKLLTTKSQLQRDATHIVMGNVLAITSTTERVKEYGVTHFVAEIAINRVEKGEGLKPEEKVHVRYWAQGWAGKDTPLPGMSDHYSPTPKNGDVVRVYLVNKGYNGAGQTTDGGYDVYFKNGFEILLSAADRTKLQN